MVTRRPFLRELWGRTPLESLVGPKRFIAPDVFVTGAGSVGMGIGIAGADFETLSPEAIDAILGRFRESIRLLGPGFRVYQFLAKRAGSKVAHFAYSDVRVLGWTGSREHFLNESGLYEIRLVMVVLYEPEGNGIVPKLKRYAFAKIAAALDQECIESADILRDAAEAFVERLHDSLGAKLLTESEFYEWLRDYLNPDKQIAKAHRYSPDEEISYSAADTGINLKPKDYMAWGEEYKLRALVLKTLPSQTLPEDRNLLPFLLRELQSRVKCDLIVCTEWAAEGIRQSLRAAKFKRRIRSGQTNEHKKTVDLDAKDDVSDLGEVQREMRRRGYGKFSLTVLLFSKEETRLKESVATVQSIQWDGVFIEEKNRRIRFSTFLATIPGNTLWNVHRFWLSTVNYVDLSFLFNLNQGEPRNEHLKREFLSVFETEDGTPHYLNLHADGGRSELAHTLMLGRSRAGKSMLANQIIGDFQKYGGYTYVLDLGGSYRAVTREFDGAYVELDMERWKLRIAPLAQKSTHFIHQFVRQLIENEGLSISTEADQDLYERICALRHVDPGDRNLSWLNEILPGELKGSLHRWIGKGAYSRIFDNTEDDVELKRFETFDFNRMEEHPKAIGPLLFYFFHRIDEVVNDPKLLNIPKLLVIDEGWKWIMDWVVGSLKTWPKNNGQIMFITQSESDMPERFLKAASEACQNKIFLPNPGFDPVRYGALYGLNSRQLELVKSMVRPQFLVDTSTDSHLLRYRVAPDCKATYESQRKAEAIA